VAQELELVDQVSPEHNGSSVAKGAGRFGSLAVFSVVGAVWQSLVLSAGLAVFSVVGAVAGAGALAFAATHEDNVGELAKTGGKTSSIAYHRIFLKFIVSPCLPPDIDFECWPHPA